MSDSELLPCPFCGSEPVTCRDDSYGSCWIECHEYECQCAAANGDPDMWDAVVKAWNRREPAPEEKP